MEVKTNNFKQKLNQHILEEKTTSPDLEDNSPRPEDGLENYLTLLPELEDELDKENKVDFVPQLTNGNRVGQDTGANVRAHKRKLDEGQPDKKAKVGKSPRKSYKSPGKSNKSPGKKVKSLRDFYEDDGNVYIVDALNTGNIGKFRHC